MSLSFNSVLDLADFKRGYAITLFSIWSIGVDIPRLLVRYGKAYPPVINIHSISMLMIGLITIMYVIAEVVMYQKYYGANYYGVYGAAMGQFVVSIILSCLILVQFILGFLTRVELFRSQLSGSLFGLKWVHKALGNCLVLLGKALATLIVYSEWSNNFFRAWMFCLGGLAILYIVSEVIYRSESRSIIYKCLFRHHNKQARYHNDIYQKLTEGREQFENYQAKGVRYIIIDNTMYYIDEHFMHPGGEHVFSLLNGKEVNYYLKGARSIAAGYPRHNHSKYVAKYLENRIIGELEVDPLLINQKLSTQVADWKIVSSIKTTYPGAHLLTFETDAGYVREGFKISNFGKYVMMGCSTEQILNKTERPYYFCLSLSDFQRTVLDKLRNYYKFYYYQQPIEEQEKKDVPSVAGRLCFFIKEYKRGLFTRFLLNAPKDRVFSLTGPYGSGLKLKQKSAGYYIIIAAGIGIVPFMDLFSYMLHKTLYDLIKIKASSPSLRKIVHEQCSYESLSGLRILLVGSFTSSQKFYLSTPIKELYYLNRKHGLKNFNIMLHYQNTEVEHEIKMIKDNFNRQFLVDLISQEQPDHVYYSGPSALEQVVRKTEPDFKLRGPIHYL